jgi:amidase
VDAQSTLVEMVAALRRREVSSRALLEACLARIDHFGDELNAVVTVDRPAARSRADAADRALETGVRLGALHGIPITIKDALLTRDLRTTGGALPDYRAVTDAPAVARVAAAGAIVFGKTNLPTWSGDSQSNNAIFGRARNPWDLDRSPGGSSGGAAAAIAAGLAAADLGTDLGGSLRIPAGFCGIASHKPTFGVICGLGTLLFPGSEQREPDLAVVGPMARSVADLQLLLGVLIGDPDHPHPRPARRLGPIRLAAWFDEPGHALSGDVRDVLERAVATLEAAGMTIDSIARPAVNLDETCALTVELADAALSESPAHAGRGLRHCDWLRLDARRRRLRAEWTRFVERFDAVLCPVAATVATPHDDETTATRLVDVDGVRRPETAGTAWDVLVTGLEVPATTVAAGLTPAGLPVGVQVVGRYLDDWTTLEVAARVEAALGHRLVPPRYSA